jgi:hypothetical protein
MTIFLRSVSNVAPAAVRPTAPHAIACCGPQIGVQ